MEVYSDVNIEGAVTRFQYSINYGVRWWVAKGLSIGFYVDSNGITFGVDNLFRVLIMEILRVVQQESKMVSMMLSFDVLLVG